MQPSSLWKTDTLFRMSEAFVLDSSTCDLGVNSKAMFTLRGSGWGRSGWGGEAWAGTLAFFGNVPCLAGVNLGVLKPQACALPVHVGLVVRLGVVAGTTIFYSHFFGCLSTTSGLELHCQLPTSIILASPWAVAAALDAGFEAVKRVDFERMECPKCGDKFQPTAPAHQ